MSLAQRRTTDIGTDRNETSRNTRNSTSVDASTSPRSKAWRTLSYDAFAVMDIKSPKVEDQTPISMADYKVSVAKRAAQVSFALLACMLASGIVCGFAALKPILITEGLCGDLCPPDWPDAQVNPCPEQDMHLNFFFISASMTLNVSAVFAGYTLDRHGRRTCWIIAALVLALGSGVMAAAFSLPDFDGYVAGNLLLGLGGIFLFVSSFRLANAFPMYSGIIVALVTGAFDASAAVFLLYRLAYEASGCLFKPAHFFTGFLIVPVAILLAELALMPPHAYHSRPEVEDRLEKAQDATEDVHDSDDETGNALLRIRSRRAEQRLARLETIETVTGDAIQRRRRDERASRRQHVSGVWGVLHDLPVGRQMRTPWFWLILALTALQMLHMNYFIATLRSQYRYMLGSETLAGRVNGFFDVALPVAGVLSTPFIGMLLNEVRVTVTLAVLTVFIILVGGLNCITYLWAEYATVVTFCFFRPLYYSAMSDYATKVFGFATFGRIYGIIICVSGLLQFIQPGLDKLTHGPLQGSPTVINIFFAVAGSMISVSLTIFVHVKGKAFRRERNSEHPDEEPMGLIEGAWSGYGTISNDPQPSLDLDYIAEVESPSRGGSRN